MPTDIRKATPADAEQAAEVFLAARASMTYLPKLHADAETRAFVKSVVERGDTWVAVREGKIVGFAALKEDMLEHLYVHPSRFNTKTGTKLFEQVQKARPGGFQFWVFQQNTGARRFYEHHGCALARLTEGKDNEEKLPDALYVWPADRKSEF